jgi:TonB-dependent starch-binding outer membrane protein SusC
MIYEGPVQQTHFGSILNTLKYKNITFSVMLSCKFGHVFRKSSINYDNTFKTWTGHSDYALRWLRSGDEKRTSVPSLPDPDDPAALYRDAFHAHAEIQTVKADHLRLEDMKVEYEFPFDADSGIFQKCVFYVLAANLGVLWRANKHQIDPYYPDGAINPATYTVGMQVSFK